MVHGCCIFNSCLSSLLLTWGSVSFIHVLRVPQEQFNASYPFAVFTLLAAAVMMIIGLTLLSFSLFNISKDIFTNTAQVKHGVCCSLFLLLLLQVLCIASMGVFFRYADIFPSMDSFGHVTLSYMLVFSLNNLLILFFIYYCCCYLLFPICFSRSSAHFFAIFTVAGFPLIILSIYSSTINDHIINEAVRSLTLTSLISSWMLAISILLALLAYNILFKLDYSTNCNLIMGGSFLSLINVCFPYLSVELLLQFIYTNYLIGVNTPDSNLFVYDKPYASMVLAEVYFVFFIGIGVVVNANIIIQYKLEYLGAYSARQQLLFQSLSVLIEQTLVLTVINTRLWEARPQDGGNQESAIILGIIIFGSALIVLHLVTQFLLFRYSTPDDSLIKILSISMILEYLLLILLTVVMILIAIFSGQKKVDKLFQEQQIVFLAVVSFTLMFTYPRILYTNVVIFPKTLLIPVVDIQRQDNQMIELIKIDFEAVLQNLTSSQIKELEYNECSICLSPFETEEENPDAASISRLRTCGHVFHQKCIKGWLQFRGICPLDRKKVEAIQ